MLGPYVKVAGHQTVRTELVRLTKGLLFVQSRIRPEERKRKMSQIIKVYLLLARYAGHYTESFDTDAAGLPTANCLDHRLVSEPLFLLLLCNTAHCRESQTQHMIT